MLGVFFQSLLIGYSGAVMPGSLLTYTIERSLKYGAKTAMLVPLGHVLLELALVVALFFGFGNSLSSNSVQIAIGLFGGLLLLYLGWGMIKDGVGGRAELVLEQEGKERSRGGLILAGAALSLGNPYFLLWWAVVGLGLIMSAYSRFGLLGIVLVYFGHILADITWYGFVAALVDRARSFFQGKAYRLLVVCLGGLLFVFGGGFLLNALRAFGSLKN